MALNFLHLNESEILFRFSLYPHHSHIPIVITSTHFKCNDKFGSTFLHDIAENPNAQYVVWNLLHLQDSLQIFFVYFWPAFVTLELLKTAFFNMYSRGHPFQVFQSLSTFLLVLLWVYLLYYRFQDYCDVIVCWSPMFHPKKLQLVQKCCHRPSDWRPKKWPCIPDIDLL